MERYKSSSGKMLIHDSYNKLLQAWGTDFEEKSFETTYGLTHIIITGDRSNPPLMLFHGTADNSAMMWIYNMKDLSKEFYVIAVDAIGGSGKSEPNDEYWRSFNQITWMDDIVTALDIQYMNICGVSYGAYLAYYYTLKRPDKVNKVACLAGRIPSNSFEVLFKMMTAFLPEALFPSEKNCTKLLNQLSGPRRSTFHDNKLLTKHWYYLLKYFNNRSIMQHKIEIHTDEEIAELRDKVLFLIGEYDRLSNCPKAIRRLKDNQMNYKIIPDTGHAINHEQANLINMEVIRFLH
ncbi:alpha/beta fold hydrolase [Paenibacillus xylanilyticus]